MEDVVDIIHRIVYEVHDAGLKEVRGELAQQLNQIENLGKRQIKLSEIYNKTSDDEIKKRERILGLMGKNKQALEGIGNALEKTVIHNKAFNETLVKEQGLIGALNTKLEILENRRKRATSTQEIGRYNRLINQTQRQLAQTNTVGLNTPKPAAPSGGGGLGGMLGGVGRYLPAIAAGFSFVQLGTEIFDITKRFEKFNAILKNSYQDSTQASLAFQKIQSFAAATPYAVDELVSSFIKLKNRGFDPTKEELTQIGAVS